MLRIYTIYRIYYNIYYIKQYIIIYKLYIKHPYIILHTLLTGQRLLRIHIHLLFLQGKNKQEGNLDPSIKGNVTIQIAKYRTPCMLRNRKPPVIGHSRPQLPRTEVSDVVLL